MPTNLSLSLALSLSLSSSPSLAPYLTPIDIHMDTHTYIYIHMYLSLSLCVCRSSLPYVISPIFGIFTALFECFRILWSFGRVSGFKPKSSEFVTPRA